MKKIEEEDLSSRGASRRNFHGQLHRFLSAKHINRQRLQLVGFSAMLIASKYEEISPPKVEDFVYITYNTFTRQGLVSMETDILLALQFELECPTIKSFLRFDCEETVWCFYLKSYGFCLFSFCVFFSFYVGFLHRQFTRVAQEDFNALLSGITVADRIKRTDLDAASRAGDPDEEKYRLGYGVAGKGVKLPWYVENKRKYEDIVRGEEEGAHSESKKKSGKKSLKELREERLKMERIEKERERALFMKQSQRNGGFSRSSRREYESMTSLLISTLIL